MSTKIKTLQYTLICGLGVAISACNSGGTVGETSPSTTTNSLTAATAQNLDVFPLQNQLEVGEEQQTIVAVRNFTTPVTISLKSSNPEIMTVSPATCEIKSQEDNGCMITYTGKSAGEATFIASATGYTTYKDTVSVYTEPTAPSKAMTKDSSFVMMGVVGLINSYNYKTGEFANVVPPSGGGEAAIVSMAVNANGELVSADNFGFIRISKDSGATWSVAKSPDYDSTDLGQMVGSGNDLIAVAANWDTWMPAPNNTSTNTEDYISVSHDGGHTWSIKYKEFWGDVYGKGYYGKTFNTLAFNANKVAVAVSEMGNKAFVSSDGGDTWAVKNIPNSKGYSLDKVVANGKNFIAVGQGGSIAVSNDNGNTWVDKSMASSQAVGDFWGVAAKGNVVVAASIKGNMVVSKDNGATWTKTTLPTKQPLSDVTTVDGKTFVAVGAGVILTSANGVTWKKAVVPELPATAGLRYVKSVGQYVMAVTTDSGYMVASSDGGKTWKVSRGDYRYPLHGLTTY